MLLRLDPAVHDALAKWAADELRSTNAQIEFLLRRALAEAGRLPGHAGRMRGRGRPRAAVHEGRPEKEIQTEEESQDKEESPAGLELATSVEGTGRDE
jgi:hypothetical protein